MNQQYLLRVILEDVDGQLQGAVAASHRRTDELPDARSQTMGMKISVTRASGDAVIGVLR